MKRAGKTVGTVIALALTWDGVRWPTRSLPPKALAFLGAAVIPSAQKVTDFFVNDQVKEIRLCWVPCLKGGDDVLMEPFPIARRIGFKTAKMIVFGDILGVVYRR